MVIIEADTHSNPRISSPFIQRMASNEEEHITSNETEHLESEPFLFEDQPWLLSKSVGLEIKDLIIGTAATSIFVPQYTTRTLMSNFEKQALLKHFTEACHVMCTRLVDDSGKIEQLIVANDVVIDDMALTIKSNAAATCNIQELGDPR